MTVNEQQGRTTSARQCACRSQLVIHLELLRDYLLTLTYSLTLFDLYLTFQSDITPYSDRSRPTVPEVLLRVQVQPDLTDPWCSQGLEINDVSSQSSVLNYESIEVLSTSSSTQPRRPRRWLRIKRGALEVLLEYNHQCYGSSVISGTSPIPIIVSYQRYPR
jgi:hypothetical protein